MFPEAKDPIHTLTEQLPPPTAPCLLRASERNNAARRVVTEQGRQKDVLESTDGQVRGVRIVHIV